MIKNKTSLEHAEDWLQTVSAVIIRRLWRISLMRFVTLEETAENVADASFHKIYVFPKLVDQ